VSIKKGIRAVLAGTLICILCFLYLPRCGLKIAPQDVTLISIGLSGVLTILVYRFA